MIICVTLSVSYNKVSERDIGATRVLILAGGGGANFINETEIPKKKNVCI